MEGKLFGLTSSDVRDLAYQLALINGIKSNFSIVYEKAGKRWLRLFLKRHSDKLSLRKPTGTSVARAKGFTKVNVDNFFNLLEKCYEENNFLPERIFNVDETGFSIVQSTQPKIIATKGKRQIGILTSAERGSLVTVVSCMSASGIFVPPLFVFPRKNENKQLMKNAPPASIGTYHPSGWIQTHLLTQWFEHFVSKVYSIRENPVLLILDGHFTHTRNLELIDIARKNFFTILSLPPLSTQMQPLDRTFMGPLKNTFIYTNKWTPDFFV